MYQIFSFSFYSNEKVKLIKNNSTEYLFEKFNYNCLNKYSMLLFFINFTFSFG